MPLDMLVETSAREHRLVDPTSGIVGRTVLNALTLQLLEGAVQELSIEARD